MAFYFLTLAAGCLYLWQVVSLGLLMSPIWNTQTVKDRVHLVFNSQDEVGLYVVASIGIVASLPVASFYVALFLFHTYLQVRKMTTYGYFIEQNQKDRKRRQAKLEKQQKKATPMSSMKGEQSKEPAITHDGVSVV